MIQNLQLQNRMKPYQLRFLFEYGAGGCLWGDNELTYQDFGFGPIDKEIAKKTNLISEETLDEINEIDIVHSSYLNPDYPPNPSLWREIECETFNNRVDRLLVHLKADLGTLFHIIDRQERYKEDPDLEHYLNDPKHFRRRV